jgi:hypothetical protein
MKKPAKSLKKSAPVAEKEKTNFETTAMKARLSFLNPRTRKSTPSKIRAAQSPSLEVPTFECPVTQDGETGEHSRSLTFAQGIIADLNDRSGPGSRRAVARLVDLATEAILELERLSFGGNRHIKEVASTRIGWPVLTGHHCSILKKQTAWIKSIGLGSDARDRTLVSQLPANPTSSRKSTLHLLELVTHIQASAVWHESIHENLSLCDDSALDTLRSRMRQDFTSTMFDKVRLTWPLVLKIKKLPSLGPDEQTIVAWQDATSELLSLNCTADPALIPELCALGEHRRFQHYPAKLEIEFKKSLVKPEQQWKNVWRRIFEILREEIRKIAGHVVNVKKPKV